MTFHRLFMTVFFQMVLAGYGALLFSGRLDVPASLLYPLALAWAWARTGRAPRQPSAPRKWRTAAATGCLLLFFFIDVKVMTGDFALCVTHTAMVVSLVKLLSARGPRDYFFVFLISFGFLLIATTFTVDMVFILFAAWFLVTGIWCLMLFEIRASSHRYSGPIGEAGPAGTPFSTIAPARPGRVRLSGRSLALAGFAAFVLVIVLTVPTFVVLPRLAFGIWQADLSRRQVISGFSETTSLGDVASIQMNETVVMRVKTDIPPESLPPDLKWRGIVLDRFDGRNWSLSHGIHNEVPPTPGGVLQLGRRRSQERVLRQDVYLEPISSRSIFLAFRPIAVSADIGRVFTNDYASFMRSSVQTDKLKYTAYSDIRVPAESELGQTPRVRPGRMDHTLLEIPEFAQETADLVDSVTRGSATPWEKAKAIARRLRETCAYSLDMRPCPTGKNPVEFFLFSTRKGHCEYFASALAVMLRYAGIPSRVVNGFQKGELNPMTGAFIVRQSDAHSWVEAWFQGAGWVELDATPARDSTEGAGFWTVVRNVYDYVQFVWFTRVVNFDLGDQLRLFQSAKESLRGVKNWAREAWAKARHAFWLMVKAGAGAGASAWPMFAVGLAATVGVWFLLGLRRRSGGLVPPTAPSQMPRRAKDAARLYVKFLKRAARAGFVRKPSETATEFKARMAGACPPEDLDTFTACYHRLRFGTETAPAQTGAECAAGGQAGDSPGTGDGREAVAEPPDEAHREMSRAWLSLDHSLRAFRGKNSVFSRRSNRATLNVRE